MKNLERGKSVFRSTSSTGRRRIGKVTVKIAEVPTFRLVLAWAPNASQKHNADMAMHSPTSDNFDPDAIDPYDAGLMTVQTTCSLLEMLTAWNTESNPPMIYQGTEVSTKSPEQLGLINKKGPYNSGP